MSATAQFSLQDYLDAEFEDRAPEYVDGEIVERPMTSLLHAKVQSEFHLLLGATAKKHGLQAYVEAPMRVSPEKIRIPDVALFEGGEPAGRLADRAPLLIVEILSPSDTLKTLRRRMLEFLRFGVRHIWLADPETRELFVVTESDIRQVPSLELPDYGLRITTDDLF